MEPKTLRREPEAFITRAEYARTAYFPGLDGIRAICILAVILFHSAGVVGGLLDGSLGVMAFFVLSGYLITSLCLREEKKQGTVSLKAFYIRRVFRILPSYYMVILAYWLASMTFYDHGMRTRFFQSLPYFLLHLNELAPTYVFAQSWSLGIEEKFYLLWPVLAFVIAKKRPRQRIAIACFFIVVPVAIGMHFGMFMSPARELAAMPRDLLWERGIPGYSMLMIGCLLACILDSGRGFNIAAKLTSLKACLIATTMLAGTEIATAVGSTSVHSKVPYRLSFAVAVALCMIPVLLRKGRVNSWLQSKSLTLIGRRSYGMYLVHMAILPMVQAMFTRFSAPFSTRQIAVFTATTILSLIAAEALYRFVEEPVRDIGRNIANNVVSRKALVEPRSELRLIGEAEALG